ncbi:transporter [Rhizobiaceae bacterium n13]|uniref:Transporter n=1 Tax=Ferirhizobium litorale TaxID=2927786 RepID=A0AAE3QH17_9HYPH|nr:transporter [Fererhizobium litorale]MDI7863670.1 transporter [Fererhizobium litorale]MDI7923360.1 transporter [Fererhizobium litorale]
MNLISPEIPGLVWAYRVDPDGGTCRRLAADEPRSAMLEGNGFLWLHLGLSDARVPMLLQGLGLPEEALQTLTSSDTQAAINLTSDIVHGTLVDFERTFDAMTNDIGWLHFAVTENIIVTTRLHPLRSVDRVKAALEKGPKCRRPIDVFEMLVIEFQRTLIALVLDLTHELNGIEDAVYGDHARDERRQLAPLRRTVVRIHRHLRTTLALLRRVGSAEEDEVPEGLHDVAERLAGRLETVDRDVFALQERARLLHEEIDSRISSETNRHLYVLSLMTAFLLPPTLITGFFGMNTGALPFAESAHGTALAFTLILLSVGVAWWVLRRAGIL